MKKLGNKLCPKCRDEAAEKPIPCPRMEDGIIVFCECCFVCRGKCENNEVEK